MCGEIDSLITRQKYVEALRPVVSMAVGLLKVVWAIICTRLLSDGRATTENLIVVDRSKQRTAESWRPSVSLHATVLAGVYAILLVMLVMPYSQEKYLMRFSAAVGMITSVFGLWQIIFIVWNKTRGA